jgi:t-SNARE complex subunit (syntaxin)
MVDALDQLRQSSGVREEPIRVQRSNTEDRLSAFWMNHERIQAKITSVLLVLDSIPGLDADIDQCIDEKRAEELRNELRGQLKGIGRTADDIRVDLEGLRNNLSAVPADQANSADVRVQKNQFRLLETRFADVVNHFTAVQEEVKKKFSAKVKRHFTVAGIPVDQNAVDQLISENADVLTHNLFVMQDTKSAREVANTYNTIANRHQDILEIERTLNDVLELFVQFSILVHDQGRIIDNIAHNVGSAKSYVKEGTHQLEIAEKDQKKSRGCLCFLVIGGVIILVAVILLAVLLPKKK